MMMAASAPISAARLVCRIVCSVELVPVPAMKALPRGIASRAATSTVSRSASESMGNSPVEPRITYPLRPVWFHWSRLDLSRSTATASPLNGVGTGMYTPVNSAMSLSSGAAPGLLELGLCRRKPGDGNHERGAGDIRHADPVAELHRGRLAAVLAADADLEMGPDLPAPLDADLHHLADPLLVEHGERVGRQQLLVEVEREELADVVAAVAKRHLGQVIGPEGEELSELGDPARHQSGARHLDHGAHRVRHLRPHIGHDLLRHGDGHVTGELHLTDGARERNHDLRLDLDPPPGAGAGGLDDGPHLHVVDLRERDAQAAAAVPQHRVEFLERLDAGHQLLKLVLAGGIDAQRFQTGK